MSRFFQIEHWRKGLSSWGVAEIVFDDPTRGLQVAAGLLSILQGISAFTTPITTPHALNIVVYWWADRAAWGWIRLLLGALQILIARQSVMRWRWKYGIASVQVLFAAYSITAGWLATDDIGWTSTAWWFFIINAHIAGRSLYDRDLNGTDQRARSGTLNHHAL